MTDQGLLLAAVLLPLLGALLFLPYFERFLGKISRFISVIPLFLSVCCSVAMLPGVYQGKSCCHPLAASLWSGFWFSGGRFGAVYGALCVYLGHRRHFLFLGVYERQT